jgi:hypothetical protein
LIIDMRHPQQLWTLSKPTYLSRYTHSAVARRIFSAEETVVDLHKKWMNIDHLVIRILQIPPPKKFGKVVEESSGQQGSEQVGVNEAKMTNAFEGLHGHPSLAIPHITRS